MTELIVTSVLLGFASSAALAQIDVGSDGSDGALNPTTSIEIDLSLAVTGQWHQPGAGSGVYDPQKWAVVFKYSEVDIPAGVTVTFKNHPSRAPVVWLVSGNVTMDGEVNLNGAAGHIMGEGVPRTFSEPGPGGFRGGHASDTATAASGGFGPGGAPPGGPVINGGGGSYGSIGESGGGALGSTYGNPGVFPLIGGSGGSGGDNGWAASGGGAGGGAILIGCANTVQITGTIVAAGGPGIATFSRDGGGGSGGGIRLVADRVTGGGDISAPGGSSPRGGSGGFGRIRIESNENLLTGLADPPASNGVPGAVARLWPDATTPVFLMSGDPRSELVFPGVDMQLDDGTGTMLTITARHVPTDATVRARIVRASGDSFWVDAVFDSGDASLSFWTAAVDLPDGFSTIQVRAILP